LLKLHRVYSLIDESEDKLTKGDFEAAVSAVKKAVKLNPKVDDAHVDLGILSLKLGRKREAIEAFREALRLNPMMKNLIKQLPKVGLMEPGEEVFAELGI
jgi:tetratricopeptide (TPR) repeat protein